MQLIDVGFHNIVVAERIIAIVSPSSSPIKKLRETAKKNGLLVDVTCGRKVRAVIVTDSKQIILSAVHPETIASRINLLSKNKKSD